MKQKLSIAQVSLGKEFREKSMDIKGYFAFARELDLDAVDLLNYPVFWEGTDDKKSVIKKYSSEYGLPVACYGTNNDFSTSDSNKFNEEKNKILSAIREAHDLKIPYVRIFGGHYDPRKTDNPVLNYTEGFKKVIAGIEAVIIEAEKKGVVLALENHGGLPGHVFELEKIINYFHSRNLKINLDLGNLRADNMNEMEVDHIASIRRIFKDIVHIHIKDFRKATILKDRDTEAAICGTGFIPIKQCMAELHDLGYKGCLSLEYEASFILPEREGIKKCYQYLRDVRDYIELLS